MTDYSELIQRLEKAEGPNYQLDCDIHLAVTGGEDTPNRMAPNYTASLDACINLCEKVLPGAHVTMGYGQDSMTRPWARVGFYRGHDHVGKTLPLAFLYSLFRALQNGDEHEA